MRPKANMSDEIVSVKGDYVSSINSLTSMHCAPSNRNEWNCSYVKQIEKDYCVEIQTNVSALLCKCNSKIPPDVLACGIYPEWCINLRCRGVDCKMKKKWSVCIRCINVIGLKKKMYGRHELTHHQRLHEAMVSNIANTITTPIGEGPNSVVIDHVASPVSIACPNENYNETLAKHSEFYKALQKGLAMHYLVKKQFQSHNMEEAIITDVDAELHTLIAIVSLSQSKLENQKFAQLLRLIDVQNRKAMQEMLDEKNYYRYVPYYRNLKQSLMISNKLPSTMLVSSKCDDDTKSKLSARNVLQSLQSCKENECIPIPLPVTSNDIRRYNEGSNSIGNVIPTPKILKHEATGSAYVRLHEIISLYLPYGLLIACKTQHEINQARNHSVEVGTTTGYWETRQAFALSNDSTSTSDLLCNDTTSDLSEYNCKKILISLWSDGCDPNARTKSNRGSMHITTVSIISDLNHNDENNTFVISIGREGDDHSVIRKILYDDIKRLEQSHKYFDGKNWFNLQIILLCNVADRPERSENTGFGSHTGELTVRWGHVACVTKNLPSCPTCTNTRMNLLTNKENCTECFDWDFDRIMIKVDIDYPVEVEEYKDGFIHSHLFCYRKALRSCEYANCKMTEKAWGMKTCRSYLRHQGINNKVIDRILLNVSSDVPKAIQELCPSLWNPAYGFDVRNYVPAIMHLCFLGITSTTGYVIKETLNNYGKYSKFRENDMMKHMRSFSLSWCRNWIYGSNQTPYGPWTAENFLGYSRIFKSVYSISDKLLVDKFPLQEKRKLAGLIQRLASSLNAMLARIMQLEMTESIIEDTDRHVKLYLSLLTELDDTNNLYMVNKQSKNDTIPKPKGKKRKTTRKRKINSTSNLTTLLNLPSFMRQFGPPRLYWEGGFKGEGILRTVKPVVTQGTHMSWFATAELQKYYNKKSMHMLLSSSGTHDNKDKKRASYIDKRLYSYKNGLYQISKDLQTGKPISAAIDNDTGETFCLAVDNKKKIFVGLVFIDDKGHFLGNTYHTPIRVSRAKTMVYDPLKQFTSILLLPNRVPLSGASEEVFYYCITEHWKERRQLDDGLILFSLPQIDDAEY